MWLAAAVERSTSLVAASESCSNAVRAGGGCQQKKLLEDRFGHSGDGFPTAKVHPGFGHNDRPDAPILERAKPICCPFGVIGVKQWRFRLAGWVKIIEAGRHACEGNNRRRILGLRQGRTMFVGQACNVDPRQIAALYEGTSA